MQPATQSQKGREPVTTVARAEQMIRALLEKHGMTARGWTWKFDNARRRMAGVDYARTQFTFSIPFIEANDEAELEDSIKHEIAHVLAGAAANHGRLWKLHALALGCKPEACGKGVVAPEMRYHAICPGCAKRFERERLPTARKGALLRRAGRGRRRQRSGNLEPVETYCSPCLDRHGRSKENFGRFKLSWIETNTGRAVEWPPRAKAEGEEGGQGEARAESKPPAAPAPTPGATREPERWTVAPMTNATQASLF